MQEVSTGEITIDPKSYKSGFVTLIGRPSCGKSSLLNALMGKKLAITSPTAQTTRHRFRAVRTTSCSQMIIVDTPGIHKPHDTLGEELNITALKSLEGIDVAAFLLDSSAKLGRGDAWVIRELSQVALPKILVLSKIDLVDEGTLTLQRKRALELCSWDEVVALSSLSGEGIPAFVAAVERFLPLGPLWFPADMQTDQPIEVIVAEFIREKILRSLHDEIPHAVGVLVDEMEYRKGKDVAYIYASVFVERESQKGILIGKGGASIRNIGTQARADLEVLLGHKVFLDIRVKVRKNWRRDLNQIRRFGYGEGA